MFFDINKNLCTAFPALDPIRLLDYPAEDVFDLIAGLLDHNKRNEKSKGDAPAGSYKGGNVTYKHAGDNWF